MRILIVHNRIIPVILYGGTERVIWSLGKELVYLGHKVTYLVKKGSHCDFASVIHIDDSKEIWEQIPKNIDIVHFQGSISNIQKVKIPYIITIHGNTNNKICFDKNSVFVSKNHANRYQSESFVYNGLDWNDYEKPTFSKANYFHFLADVAWRVKNVRGAIAVVKNAKNEHLKVLGGNRFNFRMGLRFTFTSKASFYGMVGGKIKNNLLDNSKGLVFPVLWNEPFGLAIIESLFYGCPIFATPYGSINELVTKEVGFLSNKRQELTQAIKNVNVFSQKNCHLYAVENFNSKKMAISYVNKYEKVINGEVLNTKNPQLKTIQNKHFLDWFA